MVSFRLRKVMQEEAEAGGARIEKDIVLGEEALQAQGDRNEEGVSRYAPTGGMEVRKVAVSATS